MVPQRFCGFPIIFTLYFKFAFGDVMPKGHLEPLGSHCDPGAIEERFDIPRPLEFWNNYVKISKPVVLRGAAKRSKAFELWTDDYLKQNYGKLEVRLEGKVEKTGHVPAGIVGLGRDTLENFIDHYHQSSTYLVSELPTPMWGDISVPPCLTCGTFADRLVEIDLWVSGGGTKSVLHKDAFNSLNCLYNGTKQWKMIEYKYENMIYKAWEPEQEIGGYSEINVNAVDLIKYPQVARVPWSYVEVRAGDCLFLPKSYYHQVNSFGTQNVAVAILFARLDNLPQYNDTTCGSSASDYVPLSHLDVDWKYPGYGNMTMGNSDLGYVRESLIDFVDSEGGLTLKHIMHFLKEHSGVIDSEKAKRMFSLLAKENASLITREDVISLSRDDLRTFDLLIERYEPSNTHTHEYAYVDAHELRSLIENLMNEEKGLVRREFLEAYTQKLGGTEKLGLELFSGFQPKDHNMATVDEVSKKLDSLLKPYIEHTMEGWFPGGPDEEDDSEEMNKFKDEL